MDRHVYVDCGHNILNRIKKEVNGMVKFEVYPEADIIIFKIFFKDFDFRYAVKDVQNLMYSEGFDEEVAELLSRYKRAILSGFFKSKERKEKDKLSELGITSDMLV